MDLDRLEKLTSPHGCYLLDEDSGIYVYHVDTPHLLVQAAGYLKFVLAKEERCQILYRGQTRLYGEMKPTLYRGSKTQSVKSKRDAALKAYLEAAQTPCFRDVPEFACEPLLQHYGIRTKWLDVVDNIWVALWFACHEANAVGKLREYLHFDRLPPIRIADNVYVVLLRADTDTADPEYPGLLQGPHTEVIDLRISCPSVFLRPHAQHAYLIRRSKGLDHKATDYSDLIVGTLRVSLRNAIDWLGDGELLSVRSLFPPASYDYGYRRLLENAPEGNESVGAIHFIGA